MPEFEIQHITRYIYEGPVRDSANQIILYPIKDRVPGCFKTGIDYIGQPGCGSLTLTTLWQ